MSLIPLSFWKSSKPAIPTSGLVLYYNFEGETAWYVGSSATIKNFGSGVNGSLTGGNGWNSGSGGNMQFRTASSRFISLNMTANDFGLYYGSSTFSFVVRVLDFSVSPNYILHPTNAPSYQGDVNISVLSNQSFEYNHNSGGAPNTLANYGALSANTWYHVTMSYNYDTYVVRIYINGQLVVSNGFQERMIALDDGYWLGRNTGQYYSFDLGTFMIYSRVLTAQEVSDIYNNQRSRFGI
jgi:hypothetical protein